MCTLAVHIIDINLYVYIKDVFVPFTFSSQQAWFFDMMDYACVYRLNNERPSFDVLATKFRAAAQAK